MKDRDVQIVKRFGGRARRAQRPSHSVGDAYRRAYSTSHGIYELP